MKMVNMMVPSDLSIFLSSLANMYSRKPAMVMMNISGKWNDVVLTPPKMIIGRVKTKPILKILVPIMLPMIISYSFFLTEVIAMINSGIDVPIDAIVSPIIICGIFNFLAISLAPFTR